MGNKVPDQDENDIPISTHLKDPTQFPRQKQYLLRPEAKTGPQLISKLIFHGLVKLASSPCNTPILAVRKKDNSCGLVQDLRVISKAICPSHPVVSSPYALLGTVPLDFISSSFFPLSNFRCIRCSSPCILLDLSQFLFACEWTSPKGCLQQLTWSISPQWFRESLHLLGQALARDLGDLPLDAEHYYSMWTTPTSVLQVRKRLSNIQSRHLNFWPHGVIRF